MANRLNSINELIETIDDNFIEILEKGNEYLETKNPKLFKEINNKVRYSISDIRTCFEYSAQDIYEYYIKPNKKVGKVYFPYGENQLKFLDNIKKYLPNLKTYSVSIFDQIEKLQPHMDIDTYLPAIFKINNNNKHIDLDKPIIEEYEILVVNDVNIISGLQNLSRFNMHDCLIGDEIQPIPIRKLGIDSDPNPFKHPGVNVKKEQILKLSGTDCSLETCLKSVINNMKSYIKEVYKNLPS